MITEGVGCVTCSWYSPVWVKAVDVIDCLAMSERCGLLASCQASCSANILRIHQDQATASQRLLVLAVLSEGHDRRRAATARLDPRTCEIGK
jgi:hypothetical protein